MTSTDENIVHIAPRISNRGQREIPKQLIPVEREENTEVPEDKKDSKPSWFKKNFVYICIFVVLLIILIIVIYYFATKNNEKEEYYYTAKKPPNNYPAKVSTPQNNQTEQQLNQQPNQQTNTSGNKNVSFSKDVIANDANDFLKETAEKKKPAKKLDTYDPETKEFIPHHSKIGETEVVNIALGSKKRVPIESSSSDESSSSEEEDDPAAFMISIPKGVRDEAIKSSNSAAAELDADKISAGSLLNITENYSATKFSKFIVGKNVSARLKAVKEQSRN